MGRVMITGGCGFIGARLSEALLRRAHEVSIIDDFSRGTPANLSQTIVDDIRLFRIDVRDTVAVARAVAEYRPNYLYHLAALHFIPACEADPSTCLEINVSGTQAVLDACAAVGSVESVVLASTAAVYRPGATAHTETSPVGPIDVYGRSKLAMEHLGRRLHRRTGIGVGIARLFNVFGPRETNPHLIPEIVQQLHAGDRVRLGNLDTRRDYVFVQDVCAALIHFPVASRRAGVLTCNIGSEHETDALGLVHILEVLLGRQLVVEVESSRVRRSDRPSLLSNCQKARQLLGWHAETSIDQGLREVWRQPVANSALPAVPA